MIALFFKLKGWLTAKEANKIANEANKKVDGSLRMTIRGVFASKEMGDTMKKLWVFHKRYGEDIGEEFEKMLKAIDSNENSEEGMKAKELDGNRRWYVHHFDGIKRVLKEFPDDLLKDTIYLDEVKLLLLIHDYRLFQNIAKINFIIYISSHPCFIYGHKQRW